MKAKGSSLQRLGVLFVAAMLLGSAGAAEPAKDAPTEKVVAELIRQLGDDSYQVREAAQKKLIEIGPPALEQVTKAVKSEDAEVCRRAEEILKVISEQAASRKDEAIKKNLLWKLPLAKSPKEAVRIFGGTACVRCEDNTLLAVDVKTGKDLWSFRTGSDDWTASGDTVYAPDLSGELQALDIRTGKARGEFGLRKFSGEPTVSAGKMYVGGSTGELWVVDTRTGKRLNTLKVSGEVAFAPIFSAGKLYFLTDDGKAHALDLKTGEIQWSAAAAKKSLNALDCDGTRVYVRADDRLAALDAETGKSLWGLPIPAGQLAPGGNIVVRHGVEAGYQAGISVEAKPLAVAGGTLCLAAGQKLIGVDAAKGTKLWEHSPQSGKQDTPGVANANGVQVMVAGQAKVVVVAQVGAGRQVIRMSTSFDSEALTPPVIVGDAMYFGSKEGLHAVDLKTRRALWTYRTEAPVTLRPVVTDGVIYFVTAPFPSGAGQVILGGGNAAAQPRNEATRPSLYALKLTLPPAGKSR